MTAYGLPLSPAQRLPSLSAAERNLRLLHGLMLRAISAEAILGMLSRDSSHSRAMMGTLRSQERRSDP